jgi:hypothetical protein
MYRRVIKSQGVIAATVGPPLYFNGIVVLGCIAGQLCCAESADVDANIAIVLATNAITGTVARRRSTRSFTERLTD